MRTLEEMISLVSLYYDDKEFDKIVVYGFEANKMSADLLKIFPNYNIHYMLTDNPVQKIKGNKENLMIYTGKNIPGGKYF